MTNKTRILNFIAAVGLVAFCLFYMMPLNAQATLLRDGVKFPDGTIQRTAIDSGQTPGDMLFWDGSKWTVIQIGTPGQVLTISGGQPGWADPDTTGGGVTLPTVVTNSISNITETTADGGGDVTNDGGYAVIAKGVCWNTASNPTIADSKTTDGSGTGSFTSSVSGLSGGTTYYVKAYATTSSGTGYGNEISFTTSALVVGQSYQGGIIAYILQAGDAGYIAGQTHGLITSSSDQGTAEWGCGGTLIGTSSNYGTGQANTTAIVNGCATAGTAAKLCNDLVIGIYGDWYLPSKDELFKIYPNKSSIGGYASTYYWTSSEFSKDYVHYQHFSNGIQLYDSKNNLYRVRAVRAF